MKNSSLSHRFRHASEWGVTLCAVLLSALPLSGCLADREAARDDVQEIAQNSYDGLDEIRPKRDVADSSPLIEEDAPWFGASTIPAQTGDLLPDKMEQDNSLVLTFEEPLTLEQVANRIQAATNIRVMVENAGGPSGGAGGATTGGARSASGSAAPADNGAGGARFLPADGMEVTGGRVVWQGKLSNLLDQIADRFDAEWTYSGNNIRINQQIVRTFMLHALAGSTDVGGSVKTSSGDSGLPQQSVDSTSKLALWEEIQKSIDTIIDGRARASYSPATGTITVAGYPSAVKSTEEYLRLQNKLRLRRVALEAKILSVRLNKQNQNNFDLDFVLKGAIDNIPFVYSSGIASGNSIGRDVQAGVFHDLPAGAASQAVITRLGAVAERIAVEYSGTLVTLSDQPAPLQVATKQAYVARVSGSSSDTTSSTSLEPGTIDIGLSMNILPRVIEQDRIMLRIALGITDLVNLATFTSGGSTVQLPEVDTTGFLQNAVLRTGETLVLAGFERRSAQNTQTGVGHPSNWILGGGEDFDRGREIRVLMVTANLLPEEPVSVVSP